MDTMDPIEINKLDAAFATILDAIGAFQKNLSPRDLRLLQIGMRASHAEEALSRGEVDRARSHFHALVELARTL